MADSSAQDTPSSPIGQLLKHLGMTREDLERRSSQMRDFLTTENSEFSRVLDHDKLGNMAGRTGSVRPTRSRASPSANASIAPPLPQTPVRSGSADTNPPHRMDSMDAVIERKSRLSRREKRAKKEKVTRMPPSPSPLRSWLGREYSAPSRASSRASTSEQSSSSYQQTSAASSYPYSYYSAGHSYPYGHYVVLPPSSPLPSTPPRSSSPPIVNIVSSPGPPIEDEEDVLYTLPPGPYPDEKPELSYAALVGQAILSTKDQRLSLQHIYQWISTVFPYFKRSDQTWMNSIRHVLSTTPVFRKVSRANNKSQWAIWDKDLPCFANGSFDRKLCADMNERQPVKRGPRKRLAEDAAGSSAKRLKQESPTPVPLPSTSGHHVLSNPHLQPYYSACSYRSFSIERPRSQSSASFPSLNHVATLAQTSSYTKVVETQPVAISKSPTPPTSSAPAPGLSPSLSSSLSPLISSGDSSFQSIHAEDVRIADTTDFSQPSVPPLDALEPSVTLLTQEKPGKKTRCPRKGKAYAKIRDAKSPPLVPTRPYTPPRASASSILQISPTLTPLSHKGLNMSPSASLVHYKTNLDPPPIAPYTLQSGSEQNRTPSRKSGSSHSHLLHHSLTPRKLSFQLTEDSPFRTTPSAVFDPYDAGTLLDEELKRFGDQDTFSSPAGLFGRNKGLLYESPGCGLPSPSKWW